MKNLFIIITSIALLTAAILGAISYTQLKQEKAELISIEERIGVVKKQIKQTEEKVTDLERQNELLQQEILESENQVSAYNAQLSELKDKKMRLLQKLQNKRTQLTSLKEELGNLIKERDSLASKSEQLISRQQYTRDEVIKLREAKRQLEEDIKKYIKPEKGIELEKIVVKLSGVCDGSISEVSDKYGFAIIDIGSNDGIITGDILGVYRDNELISEVVVEKVFEDMSSIVPAEGYTDTRLMASDRVSLMR